jgi:hypothetical protein
VGGSSAKAVRILARRYSVAPRPLRARRIVQVGAGGLEYQNRKSARPYRRTIRWRSRAVSGQKRRSSASGSLPLTFSVQRLVCTRDEVIEIIVCLELREPNGDGRLPGCCQVRIHK